MSRSFVGPTTRLAALAALLVVAPACQVTYTIGGSDSAGASDSDDHSSDGDDHSSDDLSDSEYDSVGSASDSESGSDTCPDGPTSCGEPTCPDGQILCGSDCVAADSCCLAACDPVRERCDGGECRCRDGLVLCGGTCVDTRSDPRHCGECDNDCGDKGFCNASKCIEACGDGRVPCDGACVELASDPLHCDGCGNGCAGDEVCIAGDCRPYAYAGECLTCPCPDACVGDLDVCCDSAYLGAAVCIDGGCD
ncbi:hypothetical protein [Nannocystis radixulma]|uniref:Tryptophan synthase alpha chain n=1 Tax=Nannocystis radixulma TaxID=2995305 RepID=A0ABT5BM24_9BACT|nr:hypothetical protein [Nannocystis radixulma]MDC0675206.1 hypothetical protein [Nannocystis radixulma]